MQHVELAGRWTRLGAAFIDGLISIVITVPVMMYFGLFDLIEEGAEFPLSLS